MKNLVILPIIPWNVKIVQRPHHLAKQFAENDYAVHYIDAHRADKILPHSVVYECEFGCGGNVTEYTMPVAQYREFKKGNSTRPDLSRWIKAHCSGEQKKPEVILVNAPYWAEVAIQLQESTGAFLIYDVLDHFAGFKDLGAMPRLSEFHEKLLKCADLVTHTAHSLKPKECKASLYLPNACEFDHWNEDRSPQGSRPGYFGVKSHWFDEEAAGKIINLEIIGPGSATGTTVYSKLPKVASKWGCGVIPFLPMPITQSTNPIKFYEYMALGLPVVATDLEEIRAMSDAMPEIIRPYLVGDGQDWTDAVEDAIREDTEDLILQRKAWAENETWECRYRAISEVIPDGANRESTIGDTIRL